MRVLICGGRDYTDLVSFVRFMMAFERERGPVSVVIHGNASGADSLAHLWANARLYRLQELAFPANWHLLGRRAGPVRNRRMLSEGRPDVVVAFPGGRGTADMVSTARRAGIEVVNTSGS